MNKQLNNAFIDVRKAFRLLYRYQSRVLDIVGYIREHTVFNYMWGRRLFCKPIGTKRGCPDNYANLAVFTNMWAWDFMYNYIFEYYFGEEKIGRKTVEMSVIQVSDDGYYRSMSSHPSETDISTFLPADQSNSYMVFCAGHKAWMRDNDEDEPERFMHKFLAGPSDISIYTNDKGHWFIAKRYTMQRFASQHEADKVLADFDRIIRTSTGTPLFKSS